MQKFLVLYHSTMPAEERMASTPMEKMKASMDDWMKWKDRVGGDMVEMGMPLRPGKTLAEGHAADSKSDVAGYTIIQAASLEDAVEMMKDHPISKQGDGQTIEILEFLAMPGM